jgi:hypothetical protein
MIPARRDSKNKILTAFKIKLFINKKLRISRSRGTAPICPKSSIVYPLFTNVIVIKNS